MLTLNQIFLRNTALLIFFSLLALMVGSYITVRADRIENFETSLHQQSSLLENEFRSTSDFDLFVRDVHKKTHHRVTVIDQNGDVLADTHEKPTTMENHLQHPEVMRSNSLPFGRDVRYSTTLDKEFLYVVRKVDTSTGSFYLRLGVDLQEIAQSVYSVWKKVAIGLSFVFLLLLYMSWRLGKQIKQEVVLIDEFLKKVEQKHYSSPLTIKFAAEFVQIAKSLIKMSRRLGKREKSKSKYLAKLKHKNQQISDVIEAISHEFKNPVAAIMGYAQTVRDDASMNPKLHTRFMTKIVDNAQVISDLIDRLALSLKFENDTVILNASHFSLYDVLAHAVENMEQKYPSREIIIDCLKGTMVSADRSMIFQILGNLIDNGLKYSKNKLYVRCTEEKNRVIVSVIDEGIGIEASQLEHITKKFYRVDRYSWDNSLGIGLALVEYMLKLHGTHLVISSQLGVGSTFTFTLPTK